VKRNDNFAASICLSTLSRRQCVTNMIFVKVHGTT